MCGTFAVLSQLLGKIIKKEKVFWGDMVAGAWHSE
jgi:hypothetical protein